MGQTFLSQIQSRVTVCPGQQQQQGPEQELTMTGSQLQTKNADAFFTIRQAAAGSSLYFDWYEKISK
jgi:hypothetical protein